MNKRKHPDSNLPASQLNDDALKKLSTIGLSNYSIRSEKCKNDVKMMPNPRKVKFGISMYPNYVIEIRPDENCSQNFKESYKILIDFESGVKTVKLDRDDGYLKYRFYWRDKGEGLIFMLEHLMYIFPHSPICYLEVRSKAERDSKALIQWIKRQELPNVERCQIRDDSTIDMFLHTLKNVKITSHLEIDSDLAKELKVNLPEGLEYLSGNARWLTKKQLLSMTNYKKLDIWKSRFRNPDASALINAVLSGGLPKLEYCRININYYDIDKILENVEYEKIEVDRWASWGTRGILKDDGSSAIYEGAKGLYDFDRDDGKIVSLGHSTSVFHDADYLSIHVHS